MMFFSLLVGCQAQSAPQLVTQCDWLRLNYGSGFILPSATAGGTANTCTRPLLDAAYIACRECTAAGGTIFVNTTSCPATVRCLVDRVSDPAPGGGVVGPLPPIQTNPCVGQDGNSLCPQYRCAQIECPVGSTQVENVCEVRSDAFAGAEGSFCAWRYPPCGMMCKCDSTGKILYDAADSCGDEIEPTPPPVDCLLGCPEILLADVQCPMLASNCYWAGAADACGCRTSCATPVCEICERFRYYRADTDYQVIGASFWDAGRLYQMCLAAAQRCDGGRISAVETPTGYEFTCSNDVTDCPDVCLAPPCAAPPIGCTYVNQEVDECGCPTGCGSLVCCSRDGFETAGSEAFAGAFLPDGSVFCPEILCQAPPRGCYYEDPVYTPCGCQRSCGTLRCDACIDPPVYVDEGGAGAGGDAPTTNPGGDPVTGGAEPYYGGGGGGAIPCFVPQCPPAPEGCRWSGDANFLDVRCGECPPVGCGTLICNTPVCGEPVPFNDFHQLTASGDRPGGAAGQEGDDPNAGTGQTVTIGGIVCPLYAAAFCAPPPPNCKYVDAPASARDDCGCPPPCGQLVCSCGGFAGLGCPAGEECVDDPSDDCNPARGGADCGGICRRSQIGQCMCTMEFAPVCDSDGHTFPNPCWARCAGVTEFRRCGTSPNPDPAGDCPEEKCRDQPMPLCAERQCPNNPDVTFGCTGRCRINSFGTCSWAIVSPDVCDPDDECTCKDSQRETGPVCGADGQTYPSACAAICAGAVSFRAGRCCDFRPAPCPAGSSWKPGAPGACVVGGCVPDTGCDACSASPTCCAVPTPDTDGALARAVGETDRRKRQDGRREEVTVCQHVCTDRADGFEEFTIGTIYRCVPQFVCPAEVDTTRFYFRHECDDSSDAIRRLYNNICRDSDAETCNVRVDEVEAAAGVPCTKIVVVETTDAEAFQGNGQIGANLLRAEGVSEVEDDATPGNKDGDKSVSDSGSSTTTTLLVAFGLVVLLGVCAAVGFLAYRGGKESAVANAPEPISTNTRGAPSRTRSLKTLGTEHEPARPRHHSRREVA